MNDDPFPPAKPIYSMNEPEVLPPVKYKDFPGLHYDLKMEILTDAIVNRPQDCSIEVLLRDMGISHSEYKHIIANKDYEKLVKEKTIREKAIPEYPHIITRMVEDAVQGDDSKMKLYLQTVGSVAPDNLTLVNQNILNMTDQEMLMEAEKLTRELKGDGEE